MAVQADDKDQMKREIWAKVCEKDHELLTFLCEVPLVATQPVAEAILALLGQTGDQETFVRAVLTRRFRAAALTESKDITGSLRDNSLPVLLLSALAMGPEGARFLKSVTAKPLKKAFDDLALVDVGPGLPEGVDQGKRMNKLVKVVGNILDNLCSHADEIPQEILRFCCLLREESDRRLKELGLDDAQCKEGHLKLVALFFFMRYFNPAMANAAYYPTSGPLPKEKLKGALWLTKSLVILASQSSFGGMKEPSLEPLNEKFEPQRAKMRDFLEKISSPNNLKEKAPAKSIQKLDPKKWAADIDTFVSFLSKAYPKLDSAGTWNLRQAALKVVRLVEDVTGETLTSQQDDPKAPKEASSRLGPSILFAVAVCAFAVGFYMVKTGSNK